MEQDLSKVEPLVYKSKISVPYFWWAGETASNFFASLAEKKKILGTKCGKCGKVFVPPRKTCPQCYQEKTAWVELPCEGELVTFTVARRKLAAMPKEPPLIYGLIRLDGADTALLHMLGEVAPKDVKIGMRVAAKFADGAQKNIMAIEYFRPI